MINSGQVILQAPDGSWFRFSGIVREIVAETPADVPGAVADVEQAAAGGKWVAGYISYEAAAGFDRALVTHAPAGLPAMWFGVYERPDCLSELPKPTATFRVGAWEPATSERRYRAAIEAIRRYIHAGDTYQVNYSIRLRAPFEGDPYAFFVRLARAQNAAHCAFLDLGDHAICCASPELFFSLDGGRIVSRPMKGTAARGHTRAEDLVQIEHLRSSEKNCAENVMIVDMIRNDLGRVARPGSVQVASRFDVEQYPTVLQMTSTVEAQTDAGLGDILKALFPCASITGAPKVRTMQIIRELEPEPRGVYTGAIGWVSPRGRAQFGVAIRTVCVDRSAGVAEYGVGGGIVWDSEGRGEYAECLQKTRVLTAEMPEFRLLETLRWTPVEGYFLQERHLARLADSAAYFGFPDVCEAVGLCLADRRAEFEAPQRVRILVDPAGGIEIEASPLDTARRREPWRLAVAPMRVNPEDVFLFHKTTHRRVYEEARAARPGYEDVLLVNEHDEVTETTVGNIAARIDGAWVTPPVACGLLGGTYRAELLESGDMQEGVLSLDDLARAESLQVVNSVRGRIPAVLTLAG
jgi:para-aminobenzoate synthetase / 4-amino-4-deoxychorismate lyase